MPQRSKRSAGPLGVIGHVLQRGGTGKEHEDDSGTIDSHSSMSIGSTILQSDAMSISSYGTRTSNSTATTHSSNDSRHSFTFGRGNNGSRDKSRRGGHMGTESSPTPMNNNASSAGAHHQFVHTNTHNSSTSSSPPLQMDATASTSNRVNADSHDSNAANGNSSSSPQKSTKSSGFSPERVAGAYPPVGLLGPTTFQFSPGPPPSPSSSSKHLSLSSSTSQNISHSTAVISPEEQGRYLTFLSCYNSKNTCDLEQPTGITANGSPIRTMGGGSSTNSGSGGGGYGERRIYAMDMEPFWKHIHKMDEMEMEKSGINGGGANRGKRHRHSPKNNQEHDSDFPFTDPTTVMETFTAPLLNSSSPNSNFNDGSGNYISSPTSSTSPSRKNTRGVASSSSESRISLEERLRRERQRLHSNGVTQFNWVNMGYTMTKEHHRQQIQYCTRTRSNSLSPLRRASPTRRPCPEQKPSPPHPKSTISDGVRTSITGLRTIVPYRGNIYIQDGVGSGAVSPLRLLYEKSMLEEVVGSSPLSPPPSVSPTSRNNTIDRRGTKRGGSGSKQYISTDSSRSTARTSGSAVGRDAGAIDPQLSPDGKMVAFVVAGEIYVMSCSLSRSNDTNDCDMHFGDSFDMRNDSESTMDSKDNLNRPIRVTFGAYIDDNEVEQPPFFQKSHDDSFEDYNMQDSHHNQRDKKYHGHSITNGLADFVAQEEMDRYRGFWWDNKSEGILFVRVDESCVPPYRITHQGHDGTPGNEASYEDHRYPFAGESNPDVTLGYVKIDRTSVLGFEDEKRERQGRDQKAQEGQMNSTEAQTAARLNWSRSKWFEPPPEASEYLARVSWLPDNTACVQWQDRIQSTLLLVRINIETGETMNLLKEESGVWINLHHMFKVLPKAIHPEECLNPEKVKNGETATALPEGAFSFLFASERTGFCHLYLYTYLPGDQSATLLRAVSAGEWIVESIAGVDTENKVVYVTGTFDSSLEKHLYALPLVDSNAGGSTKGSKGENNTGMNVRRGLQHVMHTLSGAASMSTNAGRSKPKDDIFGGWAHPDPVVMEPPPDPIRLTSQSGMHSIVMDESCRIVVDTSSDLTRPTSTKIYFIPLGGVYSNKMNHKWSTRSMELMCVPYDGLLEIDTDNSSTSCIRNYPPPELISFPTADGSEVLHAALYRPDQKTHGPGPYPLICAVYGGPHVQRVNRSWCQSVDMRVQSLCSLGFAVIKCDNRGSARRGLAFEGAIKKRLGRIEVIDQVTAVRQLVMRGVADPARVGIYGWSYGGYLAAMCLCRAPEVFHVGIAGAPVTSWDGYDTHYTERYMGLPNENLDGYHESAVFHHVSNMRGKLMLVHGLIDENVHFRHTARLINHLIAAGKDYDILIFPDERHSPRKLRDRIYMEKRMSDYFSVNLLEIDNKNGLRPMLGHL